MKKLISLYIILMLCTSASAEWKYKKTEEEMGRGTISLATTKSTNKAKFGFPYNGAQRATLTIRNHPKSGINVLFSIQKGQFLCSSYDGCVVYVKFDNEQPIKFSASGASSHDSTVIFINKENYFLSKLSKAKKLRIQSEFYNEGSVVFKFNVNNLKFGNSTAKLSVSKKSLTINNPQARNKWQSRIEKHVKRRWHKPPGTKENSAEVMVTISNSGFITNGIKILSCNGNSGFCSSVKEAFERSEPLPRPFNLSQQERTIKLQFGNKQKSKLSNSGSSSNAHSHSGRTHSHPLPAQGKAHKHGNGAIGI